MSEKKFNVKMCVLLSIVLAVTVTESDKFPYGGDQKVTKSGEI